MTAQSYTYPETKNAPARKLYLPFMWLFLKGQRRVKLSWVFTRSYLSVSTDENKRKKNKQKYLKMKKEKKAEKFEKKRKQKKT